MNQRGLEGWVGEGFRGVGGGWGGVEVLRVGAAKLSKKKEKIQIMFMMFQQLI